MHNNTQGIKILLSKRMSVLNVRSRLFQSPSVVAVQRVESTEHNDLPVMNNPDIYINR